ncbi:MAG: hypothetical protein AB8C95_01995 [Phycisphaeraceae bacterium]
MHRSTFFILLIGIAASIGLMGGVLASGVIGARLAESCTPGVPEAMSSVWVKGTLFVALPILGSALGGFAGYFLLLQLSSPAHQTGHCSRCGYNLRNLPTPTCPECGTQAPGSTTSQDTNPPQAHA